MNIKKDALTHYDGIQCGRCVNKYFIKSKYIQNKVLVSKLNLYLLLLKIIWQNYDDSNFNFLISIILILPLESSTILSFSNLLRILLITSLAEPKLLAIVS